LQPVSPRIIEFETIDSTNSEAHRRASDGERGPLWIRAGRQESGRGRSGRPWSSPPGNLSATYMFVPGSPRAILHQLSFVAALAGFDAIAPHVGPNAPLQLKWPNDILIGPAKVAGILVESSKYDDDIVVMIGMGVNIAVAPSIEGRAVTTLQAHGRTLTPTELLDCLAAEMTHWLDVWAGGDGFDAITRAWQERAHPLGAALAVNTTTQKLTGTFAGLADDGALLLATADGETLRIDHGDVALAGTIPAAAQVSA
jgi:BirA family biotin operon repressor/biotin-[acetyl-CoA-carboxylase] ligase